MQNGNKKHIRDLLLGFIEYMSVERRFSPVTIEKYRGNILSFLRDVGNPPVSEVGLEHFITLKGRMAERGAQESRIGSVVCAVKALLCYARDILKVPVVDLASIKAPRPPRRQVPYLTNEELERFIQAIPLRTWEGKPRLVGYRFRALAETLAATGMRLSETLSLDRDTIDFERRKATVIGKGNRERVVFFTDVALQWITRYLDLRTDRGPALFVTADGGRLSQKAVQGMFKRNTKWAKLEKSVTPHIIRHTTATNLLRNGCPIGFIKEILGHERLETTCRYYLGILDSAETEKAHRAFLNFRTDGQAGTSSALPIHREEPGRGNGDRLTDLPRRLD